LAEPANSLRRINMLKTRILTSLVITPLFLAALFLLPDIIWALLMLGIIAIGAWEWGGLAKLKSVARKIYVVATIIFGLAVIFPNTSIDLALLQKQVILLGILLAVIFWVFAVPVWLKVRKPINSHLAYILVGWLILLATWFSLVILTLKNPWILLGVMMTVWIADSAAYFSGKRFGKNKLAPSISPGKTWEGVLGGLIAVTLYGILICWFLHLDYLLIIGLWVIAALSVVGDLFESLVKRHAGAKDSGSILPGHGGILDRIDGLTASLPLAALFIYMGDYYALWISYVQ